MSSWIDADNPVLSAVTALAAELSDPVRLTTLQLLATEGPHTMTQLADALGVSAPRLGNHLGRLRDAGLVAIERDGRHSVYRLADAGVADVLASLTTYAHKGKPARGARRPAEPADVARTCYDHTAGRLGVAVLTTLLDRGALRAPDGRGRELELGHDLSALDDLGVDVDSASGSRRALATACLDRSQRLPHLAGALGAAVLDSLVGHDLVRRSDSTRVLEITARGRRRLPSLFPTFATSR